MDLVTRGEIVSLAAELHLSIPDNEIDAYTQLLEDRLTPFRQIGNDLETGFDATADARSASRPSADEDPFNAWITVCDMQRTSNGPLAGYSVGLKDNISLAGISLTNGSKLFEGYVPSSDATIVRRLLDNGATIRGKNNMWSFSMGESDYGTVENPVAPAYSIGGSSSGTAAAVAADEVDIGIGGDQGGSIRMPSSFAGLVGLKPTHGLVPYSGILGADPTIDHTGPMTRTVSDAALALEALAGHDNRDPRQPHDLVVHRYTDALDVDVSEMRVGVLREGFEHPESDPDVVGRVRRSIAKLESAGIEAIDVSVPEHELAGELTLAIVRYGYGQQLHNHGMLVGLGGRYDTDTIEHLSQVLRTDASELPIPAKSNLLLAEYVRRNAEGGTYAKAHNLARGVRDAYDAALDAVDGLVMPTVPIKPPDANATRGLDTLVERGGESIIARNTLPFNISHHPALTVPCGTTDGAPVGMMFVGNRFEEGTLFSLGSTLEQVSSSQAM